MCQLLGETVRWRGGMCNKHPDFGGGFQLGPAAEEGEEHAAEGGTQPSPPAPRQDLV